MDAYLWIQALHIITIIAWMAGLLYLPRLYVYHTKQAVGSEASETFKVMERKLLRIIMNPAMILAIATGLYVMWVGGWLADGWMHAKLTLVIVMIAFHMMLARWRRYFAEDRNMHSERFYRVANEVPTVLMIGIVILATVKPF